MVEINLPFNQGENMREFAIYQGENMEYKERVKKIDSYYSAKYKNFKDRQDYKDDILKAIFIDDFKNHNLLGVTKKESDFIKNHFEFIQVN